jgi:hypothetical protein
VNRKYAAVSQAEHFGLQLASVLPRVVTLRVLKLKFFVFTFLILGSVGQADQVKKHFHTIADQNSQIISASLGPSMFLRSNPPIMEDDALTSCATVSRRNEVEVRYGEGALAALKKIRPLQNPKKPIEICYRANPLGEIIPAAPFDANARRDRLVLQLGEHADPSQVLASIGGKELSRAGDLIEVAVKGNPKEICGRVIASKSFGDSTKACVGDETP